MILQCTTTKVSHNNEIANIIMKYRKIRQTPRAMQQSELHHKHFGDIVNICHCYQYIQCTSSHHCHDAIDRNIVYNLQISNKLYSLEYRRNHHHSIPSLSYSQHQARCLQEVHVDFTIKKLSVVRWIRWFIISFASGCVSSLDHGSIHRSAQGHPPQHHHRWVHSHVKVASEDHPNLQRAGLEENHCSHLATLLVIASPSIQ